MEQCSKNNVYAAHYNIHNVTKVKNTHNSVGIKDRFFIRLTLMIYLDNNAMTVCDPDVVENMRNTLLNRELANPSSNHASGWRAAQIYEGVKEEISNAYNALPDDVVFTSGASEANNHAILGTIQAAIINNNSRKKIIVSEIEHKCVLNAAHFAHKLFNYELIVLPVRNDGLVDLDELKFLLTDDVLLVSVMAVNNEIGTVQPYSEIGKLCREVGAIFHVDAAQSAYEDIDIIESNIDMLSLSGGKFYGPTGVGVLIIDSMLDLKPTPLIHGGLQQVGIRSGTIPLYLCEGMGFAIKKMAENREKEKERLMSLRRVLLDSLEGHNIEFFINGTMEHRHPGNLNISISGFANDEIVQKLQPNFAISTGAACNAGEIQQSYVLSALGLGDEEIASSIRIGIGRYNTEQDVLSFAENLARVLEELRM